MTAYRGPERLWRGPCPSAAPPTPAATALIRCRPCSLRGPRPRPNLEVPQYGAFCTTRGALRLATSVIAIAPSRGAERRREARPSGYGVRSIRTGDPGLRRLGEPSNGGRHCPWPARARRIGSHLNPTTTAAGADVPSSLLPNSAIDLTLIVETNIPASSQLSSTHNPPRRSYALASCDW